MIISPSGVCPYDKYDEYRLHVDVLHSSCLLDLPIGQPAKTALWKNGIRTIGQLAAVSPVALRDIPRISVSRAAEVLMVLHSLRIK